MKYFKDIILILVVLIISLTCKDNTSKDSGNINGIIVLLIGKAEIVDINTTKPVSLKDIITGTMKIKTANDGFIAIQARDNYIIGLQPNTEIAINNSVDSKKYTVILERGTVISKVHKLLKGAQYSVVTGSSAAHVLGTEFSSSLNDGVISHSVNKGKVAVISKNCNSKETIIESGYSMLMIKNNVGQIVKEQLRPMRKSERLIIAKIAEIPIIPDITTKPIESLRKDNQEHIQKIKQLDKNIFIEDRKERRADLLQKKRRTLAEIRLLYDKIEEIKLYSGKTLKGAVISQGAVMHIITETENLVIPKKQVMSKTIIE